MAASFKAKLNAMIADLEEKIHYRGKRRLGFSFSWCYNCNNFFGTVKLQLAVTNQRVSSRNYKKNRKTWSMERTWFLSTWSSLVFLDTTQEYFILDSRNTPVWCMADRYTTPLSKHANIELEMEIGMNV